MTTRMLIRVALSPDQEIFLEDLHLPRGARLTGLNPAHVAQPQHAFHLQGEFFEVEDAGVPEVLKYLAELHPGREVQVYELTQVAQCPAAEMVIKKVSKDGVLPS